MPKSRGRERGEREVGSLNTQGKQVRQTALQSKMEEGLMEEGESWRLGESPSSVIREALAFIELLLCATHRTCHLTCDTLKTTVV